MRPIALKVDWAAILAAPVHHINQVMGQVGPAVSGVPDGIYLTLASIFPPPIVSPEEQARFIEEMNVSGVRAVPAGRFHMSRESALEVINVLRFAIEQYDATAHRMKPQAEGGDAAS